MTKPIFSNNSNKIAMLAIGSLLLVLMLMTRGNHFMSSVNLPSASIAVFFLAGLYLSRISAFWFFYITSIVIDLSVSYSKGDFGSCITNTYPLLAFSYGAVFYAGRLLSVSVATGLSTTLALKTLLVLFIGTSVAFVISNGSYYWFSGNYVEPNWQEYTERFAKYYPSYILRPLYYVVPALLIHWTFSTIRIKQQIDAIKIK
ncbi:hypothetical protein [Thalassotalea marina]|uniref:Uncharacterized protein n=1 Tax=Thalassotalea marina TaxID=1673741 RepID=A0A919BBF6_9GAMM|nr:hypothetical protein [Thalassotalea marina]GHF77817.1 hypothetical protein GCM10017161_01000 [Thalassotalea marina]